MLLIAVKLWIFEKYIALMDIASQFKMVTHLFLTKASNAVVLDVLKSHDYGKQWMGIIRNYSHQK